MTRHINPDPLMITLTIPFPPSANAYIRHAKGMHFPTKKAKDFRKQVAVLVSANRIKPMGARLHVSLTLFAPTHAHRDIDNYVKPTLDALMHGGCFADDEQIDELHVTRGPIVKGGAIRVLIIAHTAQQLRDAEIDARVPW